jgi:peroxiredoxin Q/BCP
MAGVKVKAGDYMPDSKLEAYPDKSQVKLSSYRGKWIVLHFYPRDDTPGCTKEACGFRDSIKTTRALGADVIGVSTDGLISHERFTKKHKINFTLLSDTKGELGSSLGVLKENGSSVYRVTFPVNSEGRIAKIYSKVDPLIHSAEVINDLKVLKGN